MLKAKFSNKTKQEIYNRDKVCIICWINNWLFDFHHIYFWIESNYNENRNDINQWVMICRNCHTFAHSCKRWEWVRQECIDYIKNLISKNFPVKNKINLK